MEFGKEFFEKCRECASAEEFLQIARENNVELTEEEAVRYFAYLNQSTGELADDELDNVSGGGCHTTVNGEDKIVVSSGCKCFNGQYELNYDPRIFDSVSTGKIGTMDIPLPNFRWQPLYVKDNPELRMFWSEFAGRNCCGVCTNLAFKGGLGYCRKS